MKDIVERWEVASPLKDDPRSRRRWRRQRKSRAEHAELAKRLTDATSQVRVLSNAAQRQTEQLAHDRKQLQASCRAEALREATEKERLLDEKEHAIQTTWRALAMELLKDLMASKAELHQEIDRLDETVKTLLDSKMRYTYEMKSVRLTKDQKFVLDLGGELDSKYAAGNFSLGPVSDKDGTP